MQENDHRTFQHNDEWDVEYRESTRFRNIDGLLVTYRHACSVTVAAQLSDRQKQNSLQQLLQHLPAHPQDHAYIFMWRGADSSTERKIELAEGVLNDILG